MVAHLSTLPPFFLRVAVGVGEGELSAWSSGGALVAKVDSPVSSLRLLMLGVMLDVFAVQIRFLPFAFVRALVFSCGRVSRRSASFVVSGLLLSFRGCLVLWWELWFEKRWVFCCLVNDKKTG